MASHLFADDAKLNCSKPESSEGLRDMRSGEPYVLAELFPHVGVVSLLSFQ